MKLWSGAEADSCPRRFLSGRCRQTFNLGGERLVVLSNPMPIARTVSRRWIVVALGNVPILDTFDRTGVTGDPRRTFFNTAFMTYASWDFPSEARGYSWSGATRQHR